MSVEDLPPSLSPEEAERLASKITPSWEAPPMEDDTATDISTVAYQTPIVPAMHAETEPKLVAAEIRREAGARLPSTSDLPTSPRTPEGVKLDQAKIDATLAAAEAQGGAEDGADATVRMPSISDGLSDSDIVAAEPAIPGPPKTPAGMGAAPPPPAHRGPAPAAAAQADVNAASVAPGRKAPAPTANMIPYVPEGDRSATTTRTLIQEDDDIPVSSLRGGSSRGLVLMVVALVAVLAFGGVFFALRGSSASPDQSASKSGGGMVQPASSKADVPPPEALPDVPKAAPASADPKKHAVPTASAAPPATPVAAPTVKPAPAVAVAPPAAATQKPNGGGAGTPKPPTPPATGKPGGIVRDNPF